MKKKILIAISIIATITLGTITGCAAYESSSHQEVISDTSISSENEPTSSEDSSSEYIVDSSEDKSSETDSSETDSSKDESSEVEKVTTKTPKNVENSSSEDDNSSKVTTTTKKTETPKTTTTTKTTQAPVTQKPATTTKTTTKKTTTHTHRWVKQWDDGNGTIFYWCPDCFAEKYDHYTVTTTTTKTQPTSKTVQSNEWIPVYNKTFVTHTIGDGYEKIVDAKGNVTCGKKVEFISKTYWSPAAVSRGDATEIAKRTKAQDEAESFISRKDLTCCTWVSSGNDHYIDVPDKHNIVFYYYKDSNGKYAVWYGSDKPHTIKTESDLAKDTVYQDASTVKTVFKNAYFTGTPWA